MPTIQLSDETMATLQQLADQASCSPEEHLARIAEHFLNQPEDDFFEIVNYVLKKNAELYQRLA